MIIIVLINEKGGVGKTTLAVHIAAGMALRGQRVLLVDGDPQGHATVRCGLKKTPGLYDLLVRDAEFITTTRLIPPERYGVVGNRLPEGELWVLPSNVETRSIADSISEAEKFGVRLEELHGKIDVVIVDTSPTPSLLHGMFYIAADAILFPTKLTITAFDGLVESIKRRAAADSARSSRWGLPPIEVLGIVPVDYRQGTTEHDLNLATLQEQFGPKVWEPIHQSTRWVESEGVALPVWNIDPNHKATLEAWGLLDRVEEALHVRA